MTKQADGRHDARSSPTGTRSVLHTEAVDATPHTPSAASSGGEVPRGGAVAPHPPTPTDLYTSLGWRVLARSNNVLLICGQGVDIVTVPSRLAGDVQTSLKMLDLDVAAMEIQGETLRWAFFCQSSPLDFASLGTLAPRGVHHYGKGALFTLPPSPLSNSESLRWIRSPVADGTVLASIYALTACAQTALQRQ